jgi:hypothetical protein
VGISLIGGIIVFSYCCFGGVEQFSECTYIAVDLYATFIRITLGNLENKTMEDICEKMGHMIRYLREEKGISQRHLRTKPICTERISGWSKEDKPI